MTSLGLLLCGVLVLPGAEPGEYGHDVDPSLAAPTGQMHDPYGVYAHLRRPASTTPYHIVRHETPRQGAPMQQSASMRTPVQSPYRLIQYPDAPTMEAAFARGTPAVVPPAQPLPVDSDQVEVVLERVPLRQTVASVSAGVGQLIACQATTRASVEATIVRADYRTSEAPGGGIHRADFRVDEEQSSSPSIIRTSVHLTPAPSVPVAPLPLPAWATMASPLESALDVRMKQFTPPASDE